MKVIRQWPKVKSGDIISFKYKNERTRKNLTHSVLVLARDQKFPTKSGDKRFLIGLKIEESNTGTLVWTKPASWISSEGSSMRIASFSVPYKGGVGDLSVIQLSGEGG